MQGTPQTTEFYRSEFAKFEKGLNGESGSPIHAMRKSAMARFAEIGFPTNRDEEWRFTNIAPIVNRTFLPAPVVPTAAVKPADIERFLLKGFSGPRLVFVNGHWSAELSYLPVLPGGVIVGSLAASLKSEGGVAGQQVTRLARFDENGFTALNTAFLSDGAFLYVPDGVRVDGAVHLLFISTGGTPEIVANPRNLIVVGKNCRLSVVESYHGLGTGNYLTNVVSEIAVGDGSVIEHDRLQVEGAGAYHIGATHIHITGGSTFTSNSLALGGSIVRNTITAVLDGEGSECTLNGLSVASGDQLIDNHTTIDHTKPHCTSHELYKSILDDTSKGVFNGKIFVRRDAQKTDAKQTNKTLLLSDAATIDTKPQLEIFADDVKCTHGAAVGQLDEEQLFYLRARGIDLEAARDMLTLAFANDVIRRIHVDALRDQLDAALRDLLRRGHVGRGS